MGLFGAYGRRCRHHGPLELIPRGQLFAPCPHKPYGHTMINTIAIWLAILIVGFFALDYFVLGWDSPTLILRFVIDLTGNMAFWR